MRCSPSCPGPRAGPAFDEAVIASNIERIEKVVTVKTGHAFLDLSVKTGLAFIDATFQGNHPKYGVGTYGETRHDAFPPTIIAAADALSAWGLLGRAQEVLGYWLATFVRADGSIDLLWALAERVRPAAPHRRAGHGARRRQAVVASPPRIPVAARVLDHGADRRGRRLSLCADAPKLTRAEDPGAYFHNNAWLAVGLQRFEEGCRSSAESATPQ